ncbi:MAG: DciA family protein [Candidatus Omnitrophota bacterium]
MVRSPKAVRIKDALVGVMEGLMDKTTEVRASEDAECIFKKSLTKKQREHIKFKYFRKGIIGVNVDSSVWLYSLSLGKEELLNKLNSKNKAIKEIRFRIGSVE